jgi:uncharacterized protein (UPF0254 family)
MLGVSPGSGGNPRIFIKLGGERSSVTIRLLWNWSQKRLVAWGDNIQLPGITKLSPEAETSFTNFDFDRSQTVRIRFDVSADGKVKGLIVPSADGKSGVLALKTDEPSVNDNSIMAMRSEEKVDCSALAAPAPKPPAKAITDGKFAAYIGKFNTPRGVVSFRQEDGEKLIGEAGGHDLVFVTDTSANDKFIGIAGPARLLFERDAAGKVVSVTITLENGQEIKGTKID